MNLNIFSKSELRKMIPVLNEDIYELTFEIELLKQELLEKNKIKNGKLIPRAEWEAMLYVWQQRSRGLKSAKMALENQRYEIHKFLNEE